MPNAVAGQQAVDLTLSLDYRISRYDPATGDAMPDGWEITLRWREASDDTVWEHRAVVVDVGPDAPPYHPALLIGIARVMQGLLDWERADA